MDPSPDTGEPLDYIGNELDLFQLADNWKRYFASRMSPFVSGDVLEVGAGLGANIPYLYCRELTRWVSLEPDGSLCARYREAQSQEGIPSACELVQSTVQALPADVAFDTILYIDVLEHIEDDKGEFARSYHRLNPGGHLVVLCPAHNFLFSPFDKAIGHFRRYNKSMFRELSDREPVRLEYLDSLGMLASVANKLLLKQSYPNEKQIKLWDSLFVRLSSMVDPFIFRGVGKSILGVWEKE